MPQLDDRFADFIVWLIRALAVGAFGLGVWLRDKVRQHDQELHGPSGDNGYRQDLKDLREQVDRLTTWMETEIVKEKTVSSIERELMYDVGRFRSQRLRDQLKEGE